MHAVPDHVKPSIVNYSSPFIELASTGTEHYPVWKQRLDNAHTLQLRASAAVQCISQLLSDSTINGLENVNLVGIADAINLLSEMTSDADRVKTNLLLRANRFASRSAEDMEREYFMSLDETRADAEGTR